MRRRVVRELGTVLAIALLLGGLVVANSELRRGSLVEQMDSWRRSVEAARSEQGLELLDWSLLRRTSGNRASGPTFADELLERDGERVDIVGFMVPIYEFREVSEFLLLPLPLECYFCEEPPMRDVMLVRMREGETANLVQEPVMINGTLTLNQGSNVEFFYTINDAQWGPGEEDGTLTRTEVPLEHRLHEPTQEMERMLLEDSEVEEDED